jgi:hypothetical protein
MRCQRTARKWRGYERSPQSVPRSFVDTLAGLRSAGRCCAVPEATEARTALEEERDGLLAAWPVRRVSGYFCLPWSAW